MTQEGADDEAAHEGHAPPGRDCCRGAEMRGLSRANLMYMRAFAEAWPGEEIVQQVVGRLGWGVNLVLLAKTKNR